VTAILASDALGVYPNVKTAIPICAALVFLAIYRSYRRPRTTKLRGPPSNDFIFGVTKDLFNSSDLGGMYRNWENAYGPVYEIPATLGSTILVLQDPGAITHLYSKDTTTYHQFGFLKAVFGNLVSFLRTRRVIIIRRQLGNMVLITEGETHKRFILMIISPSY